MLLSISQLAEMTGRERRTITKKLDALPFGRLWYDTPDHAIGYAMHSSRSHDAVSETTLLIRLRPAGV